MKFLGISFCIEHLRWLLLFFTQKRIKNLFVKYASGSSKKNGPKKLDIQENRNENHAAKMTRISNLYCSILFIVYLNPTFIINKKTIFSKIGLYFISFDLKQKRLVENAGFMLQLIGCRLQVALQVTSCTVVEFKKAPICGINKLLYFNFICYLI